VLCINAFLVSYKGTDGWKHPAIRHLCKLSVQLRLEAIMPLKLS